MAAFPIIIILLYFSLLIFTYYCALDIKYNFCLEKKKSGKERTRRTTRRVDENKRNKGESDI